MWPDIAHPVLLQMHWATSWWVATGPRMLPAAPITLALRRHIGLPVLRLDQTRADAPLTTDRTCSQRLGEFSTHIHTCAHGPCQHRHNAIAATWRQILREAEYHTQAEQNILLQDGTFKKTDLTALQDHASEEHLAP